MPLILFSWTGSDHPCSGGGVESVGSHSLRGIEDLAQGRRQRFESAEQFRPRDEHLLSQCVAEHPLECELAWDGRQPRDFLHRGRHAGNEPLYEHAGRFELMQGRLVEGGGHEHLFGIAELSNQRDKGVAHVTSDRLATFCIAVLTRFS
jgi:hypothetical protein